MLTDRANAICLLEILKEFSDEDNILQMKDIISKMDVIYDLKPDRRTIYSAVALLIDLGYDISLYEENGIGYYLRNRDFELSEILLLTDAVYSFPFISSKQSEELIKKLQKQLSAQKRKKYKHLTIVRQDKKTDNKQIFYNIDILDEAIQNKKQVSFSYLTYVLDKKMHSRRKEPYIVNPYGMAYMNEHYYLICSMAGFEKKSLYRIDRIKDIKVSGSNCYTTSEETKEVQDAIYAFSGKPENITMYCDNLILNDVIDKFGTDIRLSPKDENSFILKMSVPPHGIKFWALQYLPYAEVVEPKWLRDEIIESVKNNKYLGVN